MNNRVYNDKVNVDDENIKAFFNNRAKRFAAGEVDQYTSVVLGDNKPDYGAEWHEFEKKQVVQHLNVGSDKKSLGYWLWDRKMGREYHRSLRRIHRNGFFR